MRGLPHAILAAAALVPAACGKPRPPTPIVTLERATDTVAATFGEVTAGVWLAGERWAVLAPATEQVAIVDFSAHTATPLGNAFPGRRHLVRRRLGAAADLPLDL
jgi:uncharacterized lipoprotein YbaY